MMPKGTKFIIPEDSERLSYWHKTENKMYQAILSYNSNG